MTDLYDFLTECDDFNDFESYIEMYTATCTPGYFAVKVDFATGGWKPAQSGTMVDLWKTGTFIDSVVGMGGEFWRVAVNPEGDRTMVIQSIHHDGADTLTVTSLPEADNDLWEALEDRDKDTYDNLVLLAGLTKVRLDCVRELVLQRGYNPQDAVDALELVHA